MKGGANMPLKYEKIDLDQDMPIKLIDIYLEKDHPILAKHWHHSIEILVPLLGDLDVWINNQKILVKAGEVYIINSKDIHNVRGAEPTKPYKGYVLQINYEYMQSCYPQIDEIYFKEIHNEETLIKVKRLIFEIIKVYDEEDYHRSLKAKSYLLMLIYLLLSEQKEKRPQATIIKSDRYRERIADIVNYIEEHYKEELSIDFLSAKFELSNGYLSKLFKDHLETTVKDFITSVRLKKAYKDLVNTDYPIIEIALSNGFPNIKSFNTVFKKEYHDTPMHYRVMMRKCL